MVCGDASWVRDAQKRFDSRLARITASAGLPFQWCIDDEWLNFCQDFLPWATVPRPNTVSSTLIPAELEHYRVAARRSTRGGLATGQCDGWSGGNSKHFVAFMMMVARLIHVVSLLDTSTERKTADLLLPHIKNAIIAMERDFGVTVVAFTTDASGESRKARMLLGKERPDLILPDCFAHQKAEELITWLRSKTYVLGLIREIQNGGVSAVIRACITRWLAHFCAYRRLLALQPALQAMVTRDRALPKSQIVTGPRKTREKASAMCRIIMNNTFWVAMERFVKHTEPLAHVQNITQSGRATLVTTGVVLASLWCAYTRIAESGDPEDIAACTAIRASVSKRFAQMDQDAIIAAITFCPWYKLQPFVPADWNTHAGVYGLYAHLWRRFFDNPPPTSLYTEMMDYLNGTGRYEMFYSIMASLQAQAEANGNSSVDPIDVWNASQHPGQELTPLAKLATRILSVCTNSAGCERLFSLLGRLLSKYRASMGTKAMLDTAELNMHLHHEHVQRGTARQRVSRQLHQPDHTLVPAPSTATSLPAPEQSIPESPENDTDSDDESDESTEGGSEQATGTSEPSAARGDNIEGVLDDLVAGVDESDLLDEELAAMPTSVRSRSARRLNLVLHEAFDLVNTSWLNAAERCAKLGLQEEEELYEILSNTALDDEDVQALHEAEHPT
ncbi:hypothetical protein PENSPDRAFT_627883 [Peniophora sp. CONT]|nr:hypothetical protein PENSPDRAFT_627883 [Peniophora sp. CONT]